MSEPRLPAELRVSDADRDGAVEVLRRHTQVGRLSLDEFEERAQLAYAARTRGDLDALARDLPDDVPALPAPSAAPDRLRAVLGEVEQGGRWLVPEHFEARATLGDCKIDLRQAVLPPGGVTIDARAFLGNVKVYVPANARVELTGTAVLGSKKLRGAAESTGEGPLVRVRAKAVLGDVVVDVATFGEKVRGWARTVGF